MRKKDEGAVDDAQEFSGLPAIPATITPADIQSKEFHVSRFGGYRMRDVDEYLDQITEAMSKLVEDNQRLRSSGGMTTQAIGAPDLADTSRQADEIIARARTEAATILQQAGEQAIVGSSGEGVDAARAAVAPFLAQERDFLQKLATLVQGHAESVKGMAKAGRTAKPAAAPAPTDATSAVEARTADPSISPDPAAAGAQDAGPPTAPKAEAMTPKSDRPPTPPPTQPIRVEEPATASVGAGDVADDEGGTSEGDRSLRELFWGEE